jgi:hypothetical protein
MKRYFILSIFLIGFIMSFNAQSNSQERIQIGLSISPEFYFRSSILLDNYEGYSLMSSPLNTFNIKGLVKINRSIMLCSGIGYSQKTFWGNYYWNPPYADFVYTSYQIPDQFKLNILDFPLSLQYRYHEKKIGVFSEFGIKISKLVNGSYTSSERLQLEDYYFFGIRFGVGMEYDISKKINLSFTTYYSSTINIPKSETEFKFKSVGFEFGAFYRI